MFKYLLILIEHESLALELCSLATSGTQELHVLIEHESHELHEL